VTDTEVTVGRVGRAHGIKGEVAVEVRTDEPERRFAPGSVLGAPGNRALTVSSFRWHQGRLLVRFDELRDRTSAEVFRGAELTVLVDPGELPGDPEEFYDRQLIGLSAQTPQGRVVGKVESLVHGAQDLLVIRGEHDREILVPFVSELVPDVDLDAGLLVVADLPGLLEEEG
jgi:16S rRNA processing protein RimM